MDIDLAGEQLFPPWVELPEAAVFRQHGIVARVGPGAVTHDQLAVLQMIKDSFPARTIYFMGPTGPYARTLGLGRYLVDEGLVARLVPTEAAGLAGVVSVTLFGEDVSIDPRRARALWDSFAGPAALRRQGRWGDPASRGMPALYVAGGLAVAEALARSGDAASSQRIAAEAAALDRAGELGVLPSRTAD